MTDPRRIRIAEIDLMFEQARGWGSWMATASIERRNLVNQLNSEGHNLEHKYRTNVRVD